MLTDLSLINSAESYLQGIRPRKKFLGPEDLPTVQPQFEDGSAGNYRTLDPRLLIDPTATDMTGIAREIPKNAERLEAFAHGFSEGNILMAPIETQVRFDRFRELNPPQEGYDILSDPQLEGYDAHMRWFMGSKSPEESLARRHMLDARLREGVEHPQQFMLGMLLGASLDPFFSALSVAPKLALSTTTRGVLTFGALGTASEAFRVGMNPSEPADGFLLAAGLSGALGGLSAKASQLMARMNPHIELHRAAVEAEEAILRGEDPGTVGAALTGRRPPTEAEAKAGEQPAHAFGLEAMPTSAPRRLLFSGSLFARDLVSQLVELPFFQNKNFAGIATGRSVERSLQQMRASVADTIVGIDTIYQRYAARINQEGARPMSAAEFRRHITISRLQGNIHQIGEVAEAAELVGKNIYDPLAKRAADSGIFVSEGQRNLDMLWAIKKRGGDQDGLYDLTMRNKPHKVTAKELDELIGKAESRVAAMVNHRGVRPNYVNIIFRRDRIKARRDEFKDILQREFKLSSDEADELIETILRQQPFEELGPDATGIASSIRSRDLFFDDNKLLALLQKDGADFFETDILVTSRYYSRTFGADLSLFETFGSINMVDQLARVVDEYQTLIDAARGSERTKLIKQREADLNDIRALRDLVRGTYGLPANPSSGLSTAIRTLKSINALTMLTGAMSALPDAGRIVMAEGLMRTMGAVFQEFRGSFKSLRKLAKRDAQLSGEALEMILGTRAAMLADISDGIGLMGQAERGVDSLTNFTFSYVNLLNPWTDFMKSWTSLVSGTRMLDDINVLAELSGMMTPSATGKGLMEAGGAIGLGKKANVGDAKPARALSREQIARLAKAGIDEEAAIAIAEQFRIHGITEGKLKVANLEAWTDPVARQKYQDALAREISSTIVTPGLGDPPLWMNTEFGGVIAQFKKFTASSADRVFVSGLQERRKATIVGMAAMVGIGMLVEYIRRVQTGRADEEMSEVDWIYAGIDRSGVTGWFGDVVNAAETMVDPTSSRGAVMGTLFGPTGSQVANVTDLFYALGDGQEDTPTSRNMRRLLPWQNVFWLDSAFDLLEGNAPSGFDGNSTPEPRT